MYLAARHHKINKDKDNEHHHLSKMVKWCLV